MKYLYVAILRSKENTANFDVCLLKAENAFRATELAEKKANAENKTVWETRFVNESVLENNVITVFMF